MRVGGMTEAATPEGEAPRRWKRSLRVTLDLTEADYVANRKLVDRMRAAVGTQNALLKWWDEAGGGKWVEQTATVTATNWPDDPNQWGTYHQVVEFTFEFFGGMEAPAGGWFRVEYKRTGGSGASAVLGEAQEWRETRSVARFSPLRGHRSGSMGRVTGSGQFLADPKAPYEERVAALLAAKGAMEAELAGKEGRLRYFRPNDGHEQSAFDRTVRIEEWDCRVNQAVTAVEWSLAAGFTAFPDESGYAMAEFEVRTRDDAERGTRVLVLGGKVGAQDGAAARAALAGLRGTYVPAASGGTSYTAVRMDSSEKWVKGDSDGEAFLELSFEEEYWATRAGVMNWELRVADSEELRSGLVKRVYAGQATGVSSESWEAAYGAAAAKARELGDGKHQFRTESALTAADGQGSGDRVAGTGTYVCRVDFSFGYELKGEGLYAEVRSESALETFGRDTETVSGTVAAKDFAAADAFWAGIEGAYSDRMVLNRRKTRSERRTPQTAAGTGAVMSPPRLTGGAAVTINSGEKHDGTTARNEVSTEYSFTAHRTKTNIAAKFGVETESDYTSLRRTTTVTGTISAGSKSDAEWAVGQLATALGVEGVLLRERTTEQRERDFGEDRSKTLEAFASYEFTRTYESAIAGDGLLLRCEASEQVTHSGVRWVTQATATGRPVVQGCGYEAGSRTVRGEALAGSALAAEGWVRRLFDLPFSGEAPTARYRKPPRFERSAGFLSLTDGVWRDGTYGGEALTGNVVAHRVAVEFEEILPDHDFE